MPENSLAGAAAAIAVGMGIECDIQRTKDGKPMVFHDWETSRLTGFERDTGDLTEEALSELTYTNSVERPVSLEKLLNLIDGQVPLLIEVKSKPGYDVERTCDAIAHRLEDYRGDCAVMSFDPRVAAWVRVNAPNLCCGLVMREDEYGHTQTHEEREAALTEADPDFLAYHIAALPSPWIAELRAAGLPILAWTVNSPETRDRALQCADALISEGEGLA